MICKICKDSARLFRTFDLSKNCNEQAGHVFSATGVNVDYYCCSQCGFVFTSFFDTYTEDEWKRIIYNEDYIRVDPLYAEIRPASNANFFRSAIKQAYTSEAMPVVLDYGAGSGRFAQLLASDFAITSYDPLNTEMSELPNQRFNIIFSSEVLEHATAPNQLAGHWQHLLVPHGAIIFSTTLYEAQSADNPAKDWYISPRNGHVSIYSKKSLELLFANHSMHYRPLSNEWHIVMHERYSPCFDLEKLRSVISKLPSGFIPL